MASITSLSNSATASSIYGSRNVLSGLASGMDTESMIENAVSGIKMKITSLQQKRTKVEWQQEGYRSIIDKLANFTQKYTSYASSTNLLSSSFFNNAVIATPGGTYADKVTASGKTSSDVQLLGVKQLAKAATYKVSGLGGAGSSVDGIAGEVKDLGETLPQSNVAGSMTLRYGGSRTVDLSFDELTTYKDVNELAAGIREKLSETSVTTSSGEQKKASEMIGVSVVDGNIVFSDAQNAGNSVTIGSATGKIKDTLGIDPNAKSSTLNVKDADLVNEEATRGDYLNGKDLSVTLDGVTKKITLNYTEGMTGKDFLKDVQTKLDDAFGKGKLEVDLSKGADDSGSFSLKLGLTKQQEGSTLRLSGEVGEAMGLAKNGQTNYLDTGKKLGDLVDDSFWSSQTALKAEGDVREVKTKDETYHVDAKGNRVKETYDGWIQVDANGNSLYDFKVNGVSVGKFSKESPLENIMSAVNSNAEAGVKMNYSKVTNEFQFTATQTGEAGEVKFEDFSAALFGGGVETAGQDAILSMSVNGKELTDVHRSGNSFEVDGLTINLKGTFNYEKADGATDATLVAGAKDNAVTFTSGADTDKIVDAIKGMVEDYNAMVTEIKQAYSTQPAYKDRNTRYEPLTADQEDGMTESEIKRYEELAKQGILFGDSTLSSLYDKLRSAITPGGTDGSDLRSIGIKTNYSDGLTTIALDEAALRNALESDPEKVKNAFVKSKESGSSTNGLMQNLKTTLDTYAKTTGEPKGVLITKAGSPKSPTSLNSNSLKTQLNNIDRQIERWQDKMSDQIDRYTTKFTKLEQLIAEMNSQSSAMMGLMGGGSY